MTSILGLALLSLVAMTKSRNEIKIEVNTMYDGLRATYGKKYNTSASEHTNNDFYELPRSIAHSEEFLWLPKERPPDSPLPGLRMYCYRFDASVCLLFNMNGFISGIQIAIPVDAVSKVPGDPTTKFLRWNNVSVEGTTKDYWTTSVYFVSEETLRSGKIPTSTGIGTLQDVNMWVIDPTAPSKLMTIPLNEPALRKTKYKKQNCVPNMGTKYYYNIVPQLSCEQLFPWSLLVENGTVIGAALQTIGRVAGVAKSEGNQWFENIPAAEFKNAAPDAPECLTQWIDQYGLISVHIYFISKPWEITCP